MVNETLIKIGISLLALITSLVVYRIIINYISKGIKIERVQKRTGLIRGILKFIITLAGIIILVYIWGFNTQNVWVMITSILALVAIGFIAVWSLLSNIIAALLIFFTSPFKVGNHIQVIPENIEGQVIEIGSMFTKLRTEEGDYINIPNNLLFQRITKTIKKS